VRSEGDDSAANVLAAAGSRIGDRYFSVLGVPVIEGREFDSRDLASGQPVAIVNDVLARQLWPGERVAGRTVRIDGQTYEIVGVVRAAQYHAVSDEPAPYLYLNYWQQDAAGGWPADSRTHVRVSGDPGAMLPIIRRQIAAIDPNVPVSEDYALETRVNFAFRNVRMVMTILAGFGGLALVLTTVGLYGVVAFATSLRTREIAIRLALGAKPDQVRTLVVGHGLTLTTLGCGLGLAGALAGAPWLTSLLYGVRPHDLATFAGAAVVLILVAVAASSLPARRAMRVDPALALRQE
jgi:predicted lysophospholipase L1 biosynthesis ABC-type transport system permease subunit